MERVKMEQTDGKTRDERESCFPCGKDGVKNKNKGAGI